MTSLDAPDISPGSLLDKERRGLPRGRHHRFARKFSRRVGVLARLDEHVRAWPTDRRRPWENRQAVRRHSRGVVVRPPLP